MSSTDWSAWHDGYDDPESLLAQRLRVVQEQIDHWLTATAPEPVSVLSICAGDARDLLQVLERREDSDRVTATLLDADPRNAARAREHVRRLGLSTVGVCCTDASVTDAYADAVPADLVLLCGIFGNVDDDDIQRTVAATPQLCRKNGRVIWTRHRREPDLTPRLRDWFHQCGFEEEAFVSPGPHSFSVGVYRHIEDPQPLVPHQRLFTFEAAG